MRDIWASTKLLKQQMHLLPGRTAWSIQRQAGILKLGRKTRTPSLLYDRICILMKDKEARTAKEIAALIFASYTQTKRLLREACERGEFHIASYRPRPINGTPTVVYRKGKGRNAAMAPKMTLAERARKFRREADPVEYAFKRKQYTLNQKINQGKVKPDELTNAFFGRAQS
ncbi:hypothetical protein [Caballeronia sp. DA-9]|uniref:hypothetical protein n=1 Tax=Caballeronia sp. DA-9 TaxID=3436237 RepID=UPI003F671ECC